MKRTGVNFYPSFFVMNYWLLIIPIFSAVIAWIATWGAGRILVYKIIPSRQQELAKTIGKIAKEGFSMDELEKKISDPANIKSVMPIVEEHIDDFLRNKLKAKMPVVGMFIGDKTISSLKEVFLKEIEELFPQVLNRFAGNLQRDINIETLVEKKVTSVSAAQIENAMRPILRYFSIVALITGLIVGIVNALFYYFITV
jgi:uncharacterized membrane protein YheB (UPF0754 family)